MSGKRILIAASGLLGLVGWVWIGAGVIRAWINSEPPGGFDAFSAMFACLGVGCECVNRAWAHFDRTAP